MPEILISNKWRNSMTSVFWNFERQHEYLSGFAGDSDNKESACSAGDPGLIPGSGSSLGEGNGYPFQYFCLENSMDRGAWRITVHGTAKRRTRPSNWAHTYTQYYKQRKKILTLFSWHENISPKKLFDCPNTTRWKKSHFAGPMAPFLIFWKMYTSTDVSVDWYNYQGCLNSICFSSDPSVSSFC